MLNSRSSAGWSVLQSNNLCLYYSITIVLRSYIARAVNRVTRGTAVNMTSPVEKTLARIKDVAQSGAYYEAQQMYKTSFHRCKARQQIEDALQILQEGAVTQLTFGQITCGVELGMLLVETYGTAMTPADQISVGRLLAIIRAFPLPARYSGTSQPSTSAQGDAAPAVDECARFVAAGVKWAHKNGAVVSARSMHSAFASYLWRSFGSESIGRALPHFVRGDNADEFADALYTCARQGPGSEVDLWLLRALLQVLSAATSHNRTMQLAYSRSIHDAFIEKRGPLETPTVHFTELFLTALEHIAKSPRAHAMFVLARERYNDGVLRRDEMLGALLERVEVTYFNVRRGGEAGLGGLLGGLLKTLTEA